QAEDGIRDFHVTGVQTCALPISDRHPEALVIAADTTVVVEGQVINKPTDAAENAAFLRLLSGRTHDVYTGHALRLGAASEGGVEIGRASCRAGGVERRGGGGQKE